MMQNHPSNSRLNSWYALSLAAGAITFVVVLAGLLLLRSRLSATWVEELGFAVLAGGLSSALAALVFRRPVSRIWHIQEVVDAWKRGLLSERIQDVTRDDLGSLASELDSLVSHLQAGEHDLAELRERNDRLTDQVRALAVVDERNRLARELHDSVKQDLFSLSMTATAVRSRLDNQKDVDSELLEAVREIEVLAQNAQRETTRMIEDLRPGSLKEQGLSATLNQYALLFGAREHLLIYIDIQGNDALLPFSAAEGLYRVAQEALNNVARHAHATRVDLRLSCQPEMVLLSVRDNGSGFDPDQANRGLGVVNMQERMLALGGRLLVNSQPGAGTQINAELALSYHPAPAEKAANGGCVPDPSPANWGWLGQKLVIPVGQNWPWHPADMVHLRQPVIAPEMPVIIRASRRLMGLSQSYLFHSDTSRMPLARVQSDWTGYHWDDRGSEWYLRSAHGMKGQLVLGRNEQPLAAMQYQGRVGCVWTELIYDDHGYALQALSDQPDCYRLVDEMQSPVMTFKVGKEIKIELHRSIPLALMLVSALRVLEETPLKQRDSQEYN